MTTLNLLLPELVAGQSQPHIPINTALRKLDALVQLAVTSITANPPGSPSEGDRYLVMTGATGAWIGHVDEIAYFDGGAWAFAVPQDGWICWVSAVGLLYVYDAIGSPVGWSALALGGGGGGSENVTPDTHPTSPATEDDEFEAVSMDGKWAWRNQGTATAVPSQGSVVLTLPASAGQNVRAIEQTISGNIKVRAKLATNSNADYHQGGIYFCVNASGKILTCEIGISGSDMYLSVNKYTNATTYSSTPVNLSRAIAARAGLKWMYLELEYDGTNVIARASESGVDGTFILLLSETAATFLGAAPTRAGIFGNANNGSSGVTVVADWFRKI